MPELGEALSDRELEVLGLLPRGASNKEIAEELSISPYTVKTHLRNIFSKLGVSSRTEAITVAMEQGVLSVPRETAAVAPSEAAAIPVESVAAAQTTAVEPAVEQSIEQQPPRWRNLLWGGLGLILLLGAVILAVQWQNNNQPLVASEPFEPQPIGDTRWLTSRPLPEPRVGQATAAAGLNIYQFGGETADGISADTWVFDTSTGEWAARANKPTAVTDAMAAELFGELYVPGGRLPGGQPSGTVEVYSPSQDAWRRVAALPQPLAGALAVADGGFLYVIGGEGDEGVVDTVYVYDPAADSWRPLASLPEPRALAAGAALTGQIVVAGGTDGTAPQTSCAIYAPSEDTWSACPPLLAARSGAGAAVLLNKLYIIGGTEAGTGAAVQGELFDPNSETWQVLNVPDEMAGWTQPGVAPVETRIFAQGGRQGAALTDANLIYSPVVFRTFIPAASSGDEE